ncbi:MAG: glycoside hydrolase family 5 protein [Methylocystis sp.]|uniref:glycoside hydrolase family 5 protein n=1 Tax=Methylocystis sp. TaxID=1911079 RepID=UPI003D0BF50B
MAQIFTRREAVALIAGALGPAAATAATTTAEPASLPKGFNLPDQVPLRAEHVADPGTLRALRGLGMTHVRLPIAAEFLLPEFSTPTTISSAKDDLTRAVDQLLGMGYDVSVDLHPDSDFQDLQRRDPARAHRALLAGWPPLADHLARWPAERIYVELLNEPATTDDVWRPFVEVLAQAVRARAPRNAIIVGPAPAQRLDALTGWAPLADSNVIYACHYYDPMVFTHQGASWEAGSPWAKIAGAPFPSAKDDPTLLRLAAKAERDGDADAARELRQTAQRAWTADAIRAQFADAQRWSATHGVRIFVNEFGALKDKARRGDRLAWLAAVRAAAEAQGFGWAHWDYSTSFGLLDGSGAIDQGVIGALLPA